MKPGRELDALVAEKVMGCKVLRATDEGLSQREYERRRRWGSARCGCAGSLHNDTDDEGCYEWLKEYSTDIAAAWEVVTKVSYVDKYSRDFMLTRAAIPGRSLDWQCFAWFRKDDADDGVEYSAFSESAPHAICLAALKAVGVDSASLG